VNTNTTVDDKMNMKTIK